MSLARTPSQQGAGGPPPGPSVPRIDVVRGFDAAPTYYQAAVAGALEGSAAFSAIWVGFIHWAAPGASQFLMGMASGAFNAGWYFQVTAGPGSFFVSGTVHDSFGNNVSVPIQFLEANAPLATAVHLALVFSGGELRVFHQACAGQFSPITGVTGFTPAAGRFTVGYTPAWGDPALRAGFQGAAYVERGLSDEEVLEHLLACRDAGWQCVDAGLGFDHLYSVSAAGGLFPAEVQDQAGAVPLERVGVGLATVEALPIL